MSKICASCGQPMPGAIPGLVIDEDRGEVRFHGAAVHMTRKWLRVVQALASAPGRARTKAQISHHLYWDKVGGDVPEDKIIDVFVCKIRPVLATIGLEVKTHWGHGYELVVPGLASATDAGGDMAAEVAGLTYGAGVTQDRTPVSEARS